MSSDTWETVSMTPRRSMPPMSASPWTARWMSPKRRRISFCLKKILASWFRVCAKGGSTFANTLEICVHGDQRKFREHVQHGRSVALPAVSSLAAQADSAHQSLTDFPEMTIATDSVDKEMVAIRGAGISR